MDLRGTGAAKPHTQSERCVCVKGVVERLVPCQAVVSHRVRYVFVCVKGVVERLVPCQAVVSHRVRDVCVCKV